VALPLTGTLSTAELDEPLFLLERLNGLGPESFEPREQGAVRAVALSNPEQRRRCGAHEPGVDEVFVFRDDDGVIAKGELPDRRIVGSMQTEGTRERRGDRGR